jgi:DNA-3-methyladenine glycosylase I
VGAVRAGDDLVVRCPWAYGTDALLTYHDDEWGRPLRGEQALYERIVLEGFQAGLSWRTILTKRPAFRSAFADFDPDVVARFDDDHIAALLQDPGIVRNRAKILAARTNAQAVIDLRASGGLDALIWSYQGAASPEARVADEVPTTSPEAEALAKDLKRHGIRFMGPTTTYALMQAIGVIDPHLVDCHRRGAWH